MSLNAFLAGVSARTQTALERLLPAVEGADTGLAAAMRYAVLGGGKRLRAALVQASGTLCGASPATLDAPAAAVELMHAYSLVHDDLPAMDDAALRRGKPTCHRAYGEATAILAGDALQALAFEVLAGAPDLDAGTRLALVRELATAAGWAGMAGGQARDLALSRQGTDLAQLRAVSRGKTGALIRASVRLGALAARSDAAMLATLDAYADALGLAFQVQDDILDAAGDPAVTGKDADADARRAQPTFVTELGLAGARAEAQRLAETAVSAVTKLPEARHLVALAGLAVARCA